MNNPEIKPLTGIRAAAALWVVLYHTQKELQHSFPQFYLLVSPLIAHGYLGVDLFFILSGFIIYYNYAGRLTPFRLSAYGEYLWMRLARIWPVHMTILLLYAVVVTGAHLKGWVPAHPEIYSLRDFIRNVLLIHAWAIPDRVSWNGPAWSISCEWLVYLLLPIFLMTRTVSERPFNLFLQVLVALLGTATICQNLNDTGGVQNGVIRVIGEFFGGCGLCRIYHSGIGSGYPWNFIVPLAFLAIVGVCHFIFHFVGLMAYWCVPLLGVIILGLAYNQGIAARFFSTKVMLFGGYTSYSLYMVHLPCLIVLGNLGGHFHLPIMTSEPVCLLVMISVATAMFYLVEEPCRMAMRKVYPWHKQQPYPVI